MRMLNWAHMLESFGYALLGGLLPPLIWVYFMIKEDSRCPEPRWLILITFLAGSISVVFAVPFEIMVVKEFGEGSLNTIIAWATIEETVKYTFAAALILWRSQVDEPLDLVIYMITLALGFAAFENSLFLFGVLRDPGNIGHLTFSYFQTDNLRFIGSTLLHAVASAAIGFALAFSKDLEAAPRAVAAAGGLILAIVLHAAFNFFILHTEDSSTLLSFFTVWSGVIVFLAVFEVLKYLQYRNKPANVC